MDWFQGDLVISISIKVWNFPGIRKSGRIDTTSRDTT